MDTKNTKTAIQSAIARFPQTFGLRAYPNKLFRIGARESYMNDDDVLMLYTQIQKDADTWLDFVKGTEIELAQALSAQSFDEYLAIAAKNAGADKIPVETGKRIISAYKLTIESAHEQYWQGHGIACTEYGECATGSGSTTHEAFEDALDSLAQNNIEFTEEQLTDLREQVDKDLDIVQEYCEAKGEHFMNCVECNSENADCEFCHGEKLPDDNPDCSVCSGEWYYYVSIDVQYATCQCDNELHRDHESGACENDPTEQVLTDGGRVPMCKQCADFDIDGGRKDGEL